MVSGLKMEQRMWLSGFLAGGVDGADGTEVPVVAGVARTLTVLYGTESGNSEVLADVTAKAARKRGFKPRMVNMSEISPDELGGVERLLVIVSTWGEGDPPETAGAFYSALMEGGPSLAGTQYSVCALGDSSYEDFCEIGKRIDVRLEELGAKRAADRVDCDVDFEEPHGDWMTSVWDGFGAEAGGGGRVGASVPVPAMAYGKKNPFPAEVLDQVLLSAHGGGKETWHFELSLEGSGLIYEAGDALAVVPRNAPDVVEAVLKASGVDAGAGVEVKGIGLVSFREALEHHLDITALSRTMATKYQTLTGSAALAGLLADDRKEEYRAYADGRQIIDLLEDYPPGVVDAAGLSRVFRTIPPRLYSIASSPKAHPGEVHLTVAAVRYESEGRDRKGVASTYLPDLLKVGDTVDVFVQPNKRFRLPEDDAVPVIMVGPGTGIAPFRGFVEERDERKASGGAWLIFGDRHYLDDFLYQLEWQDHLASGALSRLDVAFSRDQPEKVYVQDRMRERAADLFAWLELGAHFYVCGDAVRMAGCVHEVLLEIVEEHGGLGREEAEAYVDKMKKDGRYQRDVY